MTNYPIDDALSATEGTFEVDLLNKVTGTTYPQAAVYGTNTLGQVLREYAVDIGVNPNDSKILFENRDLLSYSRRDWLSIRGKNISMIFQDSGNMMNPILPIGRQFIEYLKVHDNLTEKEA